MLAMNRVTRVRSRARTHRTLRAGLAAGRQALRTARATFLRQIGLLCLTALILPGGAFAAAGKTPGSFNVSSTGAAIYSISIWAPPGPNHLQPNIALTYNSGQGDGSSRVAG